LAEFIRDHFLFRNKRCDKVLPSNGVKRDNGPMAQWRNTISKQTETRLETWEKKLEREQFDFDKHVEEQQAKLSQKKIRIVRQSMRTNRQL
jgi:hypothetical protein